MIQELFKTTHVMSELFLEICNKLAYSHLILTCSKNSCLFNINVPDLYHGQTGTRMTVY